MPNDARGDVLKVWLYAAVSVVLGAWISPLLYNAGKALAEISAHKVTNGIIERIGEICRAADFPTFYVVGILLVACLMFLPWMEWAHARCADAFLGIRRPWLACVGFLTMTGLLVIPGIALMFAGHSMHSPAGGVFSMVLQILAAVIIPATVMEIFFRGIVMGVFLRAMRPAFALGMSAALFAIVLPLITAPGLNVADPEAAGIGFELLGKSIMRFADWKMIATTFVPLLMLGGVLGHARLRTASLGLPIGLQTGWLAANGLLDRLHQNSGLLQQGFIPMAAIVLTAVMMRFLPATPHDDPPSDP